MKLRHAEVLLVDDGAGSPTLASAFEAKTPSPPSSGPGTIVVLDQIELSHVWAHGSLASTPPLDVELSDTLGSLRTDDRNTAIAIKRTGILARGLPQGADPSGQLQGSLNIPAAPDKPLAARLHYQGSAAARGEVLVGDVILEIEGQAVVDWTSLSEALTMPENTQFLTVNVLRNGNIATLRLPFVAAG